MIKKYSYTTTIRLPFGWRVIIRRESGPRAPAGDGNGKLVAWGLAGPEQAADDSEPTALADEGKAGQKD